MDINKSIKKITISFLTLILFACGGSSDNDEDDLNILEQKQFVFDVMTDYYLYYDQMPNVNLESYSSPEALLDALIVSPDRFSYIGDRVAQENFFEEGTYEGIGYARVANNDSSDTIIYVYSESAAGRPCPGSNSLSPCLQRGDRVLNSSRLDNDITFTIRRTTNNVINDFSVTLPIGIVEINSVLEASIDIVNGQSIGYLALSNFLVPTIDELESTFAFFYQNNIDELVLDLRYNGGGRVSTAQLLASYIAGVNGTGSDMARLEWNDKQTSENETFAFLANLENQLNLNRLYVLTLGGTCSASELIINAMAGISGVEVITVGQTTCGKPVGSVSFNFDDKVLQPITFNTVNELGNGNYFDGITAICNANDDVTKAFADQSEAMYAAALFHIANNTCETIATRSTANKNSISKFYPNPLANQR